MIRIGLVEHNDILRIGLTLFLKEAKKIDVVESYKDCNDIISGRRFHEVDLLIFDTQEDSHYRLIRALQNDRKNLKTILLSSKKRQIENYLFAQSTNLNAFLSKDINPEHLLEIILSLDESTSEEMIISESFRDRLILNLTSNNKVFSKKERSVLSLIGKGKTTSETSEILNLSHRTIETHRRRMIEKLDCKNIIPVIVYALKNKLIEIDNDDEFMWSQLSFG